MPLRNLLLACSVAVLQPAWSAPTPPLRFTSGEGRCVARDFSTAYACMMRHWAERAGRNAAVRARAQSCGPHPNERCFRIETFEPGRGWHRVGRDRIVAECPAGRVLAPGNTVCAPPRSRRDRAEAG